MTSTTLIKSSDKTKNNLSNYLLKSFSLLTATTLGCLSIATAATAANFSFAFGSVGAGNGQFNLLTGIAVGSNGNIFVTDSLNNRVQVFDSSGMFLSTFGSLGTGNGQFNTPSGIAVGSSGNIFVADSLNNRMQVFTQDAPPVGTPEPSSLVGLGLLGGGLVLKRRQR